MLSSEESLAAMVETTAVQSLQLSAVARARRAEEMMKAFKWIKEVSMISYSFGLTDEISSLNNDNLTKKGMDWIPSFRRIEGSHRVQEYICSQCLITKSTYEPRI